MTSFFGKYCQLTQEPLGDIPEGPLYLSDIDMALGPDRHDDALDARRKYKRGAMLLLEGWISGDLLTEAACPGRGKAVYLVKTRAILI